MAQLKSTNILGNLAVSGDILSSKFIKLGGTSNQVLLANGGIKEISGTWSINVSGSSGSCTGNAATATQATKDGAGNTITDKYVALDTTQTISGAKTFSKAITANAGITCKGGLNFSDTSNIAWNTGTYQQRILITDDSTANTKVFTFQQSADTAATWSDLFAIYDNGTVEATKFKGALNGNADTATTATKLGTSAGDSNTPVYFSGGKPVKCTSLDLNTSGHSAMVKYNFDVDSSRYRDAIVFNKADGATTAQYIGFHNTAGIILNPNYDGTSNRWENNAGLHIGYTSMRYKGTIKSQGYVLETAGGTTKATVQYNSDYNAIEFVF